MTTEEEVCAVAQRFYDGIEDMVSGRGIARIVESWEHSADVTAGHPSGDWAEGWDELIPSWEIFQQLGRSDRGGSKVRGMKAHVYGDFAYTTCLFVEDHSSPRRQGARARCSRGKVPARRIVEKTYPA